MIPKEEYRLILEHRYIGYDGKAIQMEEPKAYSYNIVGKETEDIITYRTHVIKELFLRFMESILREVE